MRRNLSRIGYPLAGVVLIVAAWIVICWFGNMPTVVLGPLAEDSTDRERRNFDDFEWHTQWGTGYQRQQSTRPQTLGYGLVDSPVGQLAWVVEKFWAWTDCGGNPYSIFTREQLLDNVTVYWFTASGTSSARL